jgi:hypothetical protein
METRLTKHQHHTGIYKTVSFEALRLSIDPCNRVLLNERKGAETAPLNILAATVGVLVARSKA